ncbi:MAG TPA: thiamine pyrophosphate-binding protein [Candidatus Methylomirabilis sp.]|nr:thiamine pyrophosphate-binding protein [Candidatus Methylomirabilis sp.]
MTGAEATAECLKAQGVGVVFGIRGLHITPLAHAVKRRGIRFIEVRHEQSAAFMADAYARVTGRAGVVMAATGAGAACTMVGIQEAYASSSPVLLIASQIEQKHLQKGWGDLHEVKNQHGLIVNVTEGCYDITSAHDIPATIREIFHRMASGRPRPYGLEIPDNILRGEIDLRLAYQPAAGQPPVPHAESLGEAVDAIVGAKRPVIYAGGGAIASGASQVVAQMAELLNAPVLTSVKGKGVIPEVHALSLGNLGTEAAVRPLLEQADLAVVIGTRFSNRSTGKWSLRLPPRWVRIDIDEQQFSKTHPALGVRSVVEVVGDAKATLAAMLEEIGRRPFRPQGFARSEVTAVKQQTLEALRRGFPQEMKLLDDLRAALPGDAIVANDSTVATYWTRRYFEVHEPRTFLWPMGSGTIGFGLPAAIGAKIAKPEHRVVALCGDGGFLFSCHDLATAARYHVAIPALLFNDNAFGIVDYGQRKEGQLEGDEKLANPDFVSLAKSFGVEAERIQSLDEIGGALERAFRRNTLTVVEVPVALRVPPDLA